MPADDHRSEAAVQERWGKEDFQKKLEQAFWMNHEVVRAHLNRLATGSPTCDWLTWFTHECIPTRGEQTVLVLGCGEGWLERSIARLPWIARIDAFDVAEGAVERARQRAADEGLDTIHYGTLDLNRDALEPDRYDVVIAHSVLHHVENLEHAFDQIGGALRRSGWLAVNEFIGIPHLQYRQDALEVMNSTLRSLVPRLRTATTTGELLELKARPDLDYVLEVDPSEGVRADELDGFLRGRFAVPYEADMGGTILQHLLWELVANFRDDDPLDRCLLQWLCLCEEVLIRSGRMESDYRLYVCRHRDAPPAKTPPRLDENTTPLPSTAPEPATAWRAEPTAVRHFHTLATGLPTCDWLTGVLAELEEELGVGPDASVLWLGGEDWLRQVVEDRFRSVVRWSPRLLLGSRETFDAAFGSGLGLFEPRRRAAVARYGLLLRAEGALVALEETPPSELLVEAVERFARPFAEAVGPEHLPDLGRPGEAAFPDLFSTERFTDLGGDLLAPLLDAYWTEAPQQRRGELLELLTVIETELIQRGALRSRYRGGFLCGPRRRELWRAQNPFG